MGETGQARGLSDAARGRAAGGLAARRALNTFWRDEGGATAIEVGIIVALIAVALIGVLTLSGSNISSAFNKVSTAIGT